jgi:hypothetical protein
MRLEKEFEPDPLIRDPLIRLEKESEPDPSD